MHSELSELHVVTLHLGLATLAISVVRRVQARHWDRGLIYCPTRHCLARCQGLVLFASLYLVVDNRTWMLNFACAPRSSPTLLCQSA